MGRNSPDISNGDGLDEASLPQLPNGWCWATLSNVAQIAGGITKDQKRKRTGTMIELPYLRVANVQRGFLDLEEIKTILADSEEVETLRLQKGDILFTEGGDRDKLGRGWVWNGEIDLCIHQNHIFRARPNFSIVEPKFISFHGNFFGQAWFTRTGKQTTNLASINKGILSRFPVPIAPLDEQRRIVAKIEELFSDLDAGVAALKRAKANLKRYRAAVLKAAVEGKLTEEWRAKHPSVEPASKLLERILVERRKKWEADQLAKFAATQKEPPKNWKAKYIEPSTPDTSNLAELPQGWCWARGSQLFEWSSGEFLPKNQQNDGLIPVYGGNGIAGYHDSANTTSPTLVIGRVGVHCGNVHVTPTGGAWITDNAIFATSTPSESSLTFVSLCFRKSGLNSQSQGGAQPFINQKTLNETVIAFAPLVEQDFAVAEVERRFSLIDETVKQIEVNLVLAIRLRQSILKQAFEGKLVPQDPHDEPASVLLERINAASSHNNGTPSKSKRKRSEHEAL